jgi:hypothetical protein
MLSEHALVYEFRLMLDPVTLGGGKRIFPDDGVLSGAREIRGSSPLETRSDPKSMTWSPRLSPMICET